MLPCFQRSDLADESLPAEALAEKGGGGILCLLGKMARARQAAAGVFRGRRRVALDSLEGRYRRSATHRDGVTWRSEIAPSASERVSAEKKSRPVPQFGNSRAVGKVAGTLLSFGAWVQFWAAGTKSAA